MFEQIGISFILIKRDILIGRLLIMYDEILDFSGIGYCRCSTNGIILHINKTACMLLAQGEKPCLPSEVKGMNINDLYIDFSILLEKARTREPVKNIRLPVKGRNGLTIELVYDMIVDNSGAIEMMFRETPEYEHDGRRGIHSELQLKSILNLIPDIVYRLDSEGRITFMSESINTYGYSPAELIGRYILDLVHPEDRGRAIFRVNERRAGDRAIKFFEIRIVTKTSEAVPLQFENTSIGANHYFSVSAEGIYLDGGDTLNFLGTQGIARDITKKRNSELIMKMSQEKCYTITDSLIDGYFEIDMDGSINFVNTALARILGYENKNEITGKNFKNFIAPEYHDIIRKAYHDVLHSPMNNTIVDWVAITRDGKKLNVQGSLSFLKNDDGGPVFYIGIVRDLTNQKRLEDDLFRARKLEAIGIFSGGIAHDYNNALTSVIGNITLAKIEFGKTDRKLLEFLTDAEAASIRVKNLTQQLSNLSKSGKPVKQVMPVKKILMDAAKSVLKDFKGETGMNIPDDLWMVDIDDYQFGHVFEHIILNALEAVTDTGRIMIKAGNIRIIRQQSMKETIVTEGDYVKITISDNGEGIQKEIINNIFDPYYSTKGVRSGMGLAISYAVTKRHDGYLDVLSSPGKGSEFYIYLPRAH